MISNLIVFCSLLLGVLFTVLYLIRPTFRARIEQPKYAFLRQLAMYDKTVSRERQEYGSVSVEELNKHNRAKESEQ